MHARRLEVSRHRFRGFEFASGVSRLQKLVGPINCKCPASSAENFASDHAHFFEISYEFLRVKVK